MALAGPASRQRRKTAGSDSHFRGIQGTAIDFFSDAAAWTGVSEKTLQRLGDTDDEKPYLCPNSHAGHT